VLERLVSVPRAISAIRLAILQGRLRQQDIDRRCRKVLAAKYWVGLNKYQPVKLDSLYWDLQPSRAHETNRRLAEGSLTMLHNKLRLMPLTRSKKKKLAVVAIGASRPTFFQRKLQDYTRTESFVLPRKSTKKDIAALKMKLRPYNFVVIGIYGPSIRPSNSLGFTPEETAFVNELIADKKCVVSLFDNAYTLNHFAGIRKANGLIVGYQQLPAVQEAAAKLIFGKIKANGKLPVTVSEHFRYSDGL
jgi:beta-N-acetylhexosaminidase